MSVTKIELFEGCELTPMNAARLFQDAPPESIVENPYISTYMSQQSHFVMKMMTNASESHLLLARLDDKTRSLSFVDTMANWIILPRAEASVTNWTRPFSN